ncbi:MAG: glycosyltransferase family 2 protein [Verrucomicrobiia bacterium]
MAAPKMKHVAAVIPLYNHEDYIGQAVDSLLKQTLPPEKILIIDDGSTDNSIEAAKKITDPRIELITQHNAGAHNTLNRAIALIKGFDYITILNSDDFYHPQRLEHCVAFLEQNRSYDAVCTQVTLVDERGNPVSDTDSRVRRIQKIWELPKEDHLENAEWIGVANFVKTTSNLVARSDYFKSHFFRPYRFVHDYFFAIIAVLENKLGVLFEPLLSYRTHDSNTIKSSSEQVMKEVLQMNIDLLRELSPLLSRNAEIRHAFGQYFRAACYNFSDFRGELYYCLLAHALRDVSSENIVYFLNEMKTEEFKEFSEPPSRFLIESQDEKGEEIDVYQAYKSERARAELFQLREKLDEERSFRKFLQKIIASRWLAWGRSLGRAKIVWKQLTHEEALQNRDVVKTAWEKDSWIKRGKKSRAKVPDFPDEL